MKGDTRYEDEERGRKTVEKRAFIEKTGILSLSIEIRAGFKGWQIVTNLTFLDPRTRISLLPGGVVSGFSVLLSPFVEYVPMLPKREYVIEFGALPKGQHEFEFEVDDSFFQQFEGSIISRGHADVLVVLERQQDNLLLLDFTIEGTVTVTCDRCLDDLDLDIVSYNELVVKLGEQAEEQSDDVIVIPSGEHNIDIAQFIYEYVTLAIPMRNVHEEDESGNSGLQPGVAETSR